MRINAKRARIYNGWLLVTHQQYSGADGTKRGTTEFVIRGDTITAWWYTPGVRPYIQVERGQVTDTVRLELQPDEGGDVTFEQLDDMLWALGPGYSGSPLRSGVGPGEIDPQEPF